MLEPMKRRCLTRRCGLAALAFARALAVLTPFTAARAAPTGLFLPAADGERYS